MATATDLRAQIRKLVDDVDSPPSHCVRRENLRQSINGDQVDGSNKSFVLNNRKIIQATLVVISDGSTVTPTAIDAPRGMFTLTSAPASSLFVRYDHLFFSDDEIDDHVLAGQRFVGVSTVTDVAYGLLEALTHKAAAHAFEELAAKTAQLFDASAGGKSISKASIKAHYLEKAKYHHGMAETEREAYYKRQGRREAPAYGSFATKQSPFTPRR